MPLHGHAIGLMPADNFRAARAEYIAEQADKRVTELLETYSDELVSLAGEQGLIEMFCDLLTTCVYPHEDDQHTPASRAQTYLDYLRERVEEEMK